MATESAIAITGRRILAAERAHMVLKPFGGRGAEKADQLRKELAEGIDPDSRLVSAVLNELLEALMNPGATDAEAHDPESNDLISSASGFFRSREMPSRAQIREAFKVLEKAFTRAGP